MALRLARAAVALGVHNQDLQAPLGDFDRFPPHPDPFCACINRAPSFENPSLLNDYFVN